MLLLASVSRGTMNCASLVVLQRLLWWYSPILSWRVRPSYISLTPNAFLPLLPLNCSLSSCHSTACLPWWFVSSCCDLQQRPPSLPGSVIFTGLKATLANPLCLRKYARRLNPPFLTYSCQNHDVKPKRSIHELNNFLFTWGCFD